MCKPHPATTAAATSDPITSQNGPAKISKTPDLRHHEKAAAGDAVGPEKAARAGEESFAVRGPFVVRSIVAVLTAWALVMIVPDLTQPFAPLATVGVSADFAEDARETGSTVRYGVFQLPTSEA